MSIFFISPIFEIGWNNLWASVEWLIGLFS